MMHMLPLVIFFMGASSCISYGSPSLLKSDRFTALSVASVVDVRDSLLSIFSLQSGPLINDQSTNFDESPRGSARYSKLKELVSILELSQTRDLIFPALWNDIDGDWELRYTNNAENALETGAGISGGVLSKKGTVVNIIQRINRASNCVDHILQYTIPFVDLIGTITLRHDLIVTSDVAPAQIAIDLSEIIVDGPLNPLKLPAIRLPGPSYLRRGVFDVRTNCHFIRLAL